MSGVVLNAASQRKAREFGIEGEIVPLTVNWAGLNDSTISSSAWTAIESLGTVASGSTSGKLCTTDATLSEGWNRFANSVTFANGNKGIRIIEIYCDNEGV